MNFRGILQQVYSSNKKGREKVEIDTTYDHTTGQRYLNKSSWKNLIPIPIPRWPLTVNLKVI